MKRNLKYKKQIIVIAIGLLTIFANFMASYFPKVIERLYSNGVNKGAVQVMSIITGVFPFSLGELLVVGLFLVLAAMFLWVLMAIFQKQFLKALFTMGSYLSCLYILFIGLWGLNYHRTPFEDVVGITIEHSSTQELIELSQGLIDKANDLRGKLLEDDHGVMEIPGGYGDVFARAEKGFQNLSMEYDELGGKYGKPKPIFLSKALLYTGITGIYIPYTGEANVNVEAEDYTLPATTMHEMAHQRGYAREEEANYIAYLACLAHEDLDFQYSGVMLALVYSVNALRRHDAAAYQDLGSQYSQGVRRDLQHSYELWNSYEGKVEEVASRVNDQYLKSNGQKDGVKSYGKMVDLLLAEHRQKGQ